MKLITVTLALALIAGAGCEAREESTPITPPGPYRDEAEPTTTGATTTPATQGSASPTVANQYCAVMNEHKIDPTVTIAHAGRTIGFCCKDCIEPFEKEPAKYLASLK